MDMNKLMWNIANQMADNFEPDVAMSNAQNTDEISFFGEVFPFNSNDKKVFIDMVKFAVVEKWAKM